MKSPRLSFKGYRFTEALYRNKDSVKGLVAILAGINVVTGFDYKTMLITLAGGAVGLAVKLVSDLVDFYFTEVDV